jgi:hypothetical protein
MVYHNVFFLENTVLRTTRVLVILVRSNIELQKSRSKQLVSTRTVEYNKQYLQSVIMQSWKTV